MNEVDNKQILEIFKAVSDTTRLAIVCYLVSKKLVSFKEISAIFNLSQPTLSHHISKLEKAGVITVKKRGTEKFFSLNKVFLKNCGINYSTLEKASNNSL